MFINRNTKVKKYSQMEAVGNQTWTESLLLPLAPTCPATGDRTKGDFLTNPQTGHNYC